MATEPSQKPRVGIPYRTRKEELSGDRVKYERYCEAVRQAGGKPVEISLAPSSRDELRAEARSLDALVLPGSPADVAPERYHAVRRSECAANDSDRERTDSALLEYAFAEGKPVLAICFGLQSLNVFLSGSLIQDIPSEVRTDVQHRWDHEKGAAEPFHLVRIEPGSRLAQLAGKNEVRVNSSHHQSILSPGRDLRVTAQASDGVIEGVEWTGDANWVTAVQWHPERMVDGDLLAQALFRELVEVARKAPVHS